MERHGNGLIPEMLLTEDEFRRLFLKSYSNMWNCIVVTGVSLITSTVLTLQFFLALPLGAHNHSLAILGACALLLLTVAMAQHVMRLYSEREVLEDFEYDWYDNCLARGSNIDHPDEVVEGELPVRYVKWLRGLSRW